MASWVGGTQMSAGNIPLWVSGGYGGVSRNGAKVSFNWGIRFQPVDGASYTWTYNSVYAFYNGSAWYAQKGNGSSVHTQKGEWIYTTTTSTTVTKYTSEATPFWYSGNVSGTGAGNVSITTGVGWSWTDPTSSTANYSFNVPYPAAATYTVSYNANGGSGAPSSQTKYQGYNLTLSSTEPTRAGYAFNGWNTNSSGTGTNYSAGGVYSSDSGTTLYAKWTALAPIFSAPTVSRTETEISWPAFTTNIASNIYYRINSGDWIKIGTNTTTGEGKNLTGYTPGTDYTIDFKAENNVNTSLSTTHSVSVTTYNYPSISSFTAPINAGATQTFSLYNPLGRSVTITLTKIGSTSQSFVSTTVTGTTANFVIPLEAIARILTSKSSDTGTYTLTYASTVRDTKTGQINIPSTTAPTIDESKKNSFFSYQDCATFIFGGSGSTSKAMSTFSGDNQKLLQGYSKMQYSLVSANNPFTPQYGASISSYKVQINSKTATATTLGTTYYEGASAGVTASGSAVVVTANNTYTITIFATDSRGFTSSYTRTISTYIYSKPTISITSVYRKDGYGTAAAITLSGAWSTGMTGANVAKSITFYYKESTASSYSSKALYTNSGSASSMQSLATTLDISGVEFISEKAYNTYVVVVDGFGQSTQSTVASLPLGTPILFIDTEQLGVGVNCFPTVAGLEVSGPIKSTGNITSGGVVSGDTLSGSTVSTTGNATIGGNLSAGVVSAKQVKTLSLGSTGGGATYTVFAKMNKSNASGMGSMTVLISGLGDFGGNVPGSCIVTMSNRGSIATMKANWIRPNNGGTVKFGYYSDNDYFYFGVYTSNYSYTRDILLLSNAGGYDLYSGTSVSSAPSGWTEVIPENPAYPVNSIYMAIDEVSPASLFGGQWERIKDKFLLAVGDTYAKNKTGGSATVKLEEKHLPSHGHWFSATSNWTGDHWHNIGWDKDGGSGSNRYTVHNSGSSGANGQAGTSSAGGHSHSVEGWTGGTGGGENHDNMPPYMTVYIWKRIS